MRNGGVSASLFSVPAFLVLLVAGLHADETFNKLFDEGKYAEVIKYADEKLPIADRNASVWAKLGVAHEEQKLDEKALACYLVAIRNDAKNYEAHLGAARIYNNIGQPSSAADLAKKPWNSNPLVKPVGRRLLYSSEQNQRGKGRTGKGC